MARGLGVQFLNVAKAPVAFAGQCLQSGAVEQALLELGRESLEGALGRGVEAVASATGLSVGAVRRLLPGPEIAGLLARIDTVQQSALGEWKNHTALGGGLLEAVAKLTADGRAPDSSRALDRVAHKMKLEKALAQPLSGLAEEVDAWGALLESCRHRLDDGKELERARRRRVRLRIGAALGASVALCLLGGWLVVGWRARARLDATLAEPDPCAVERIAGGDLARAGAAQRERTEERRRTCTAGREAARLTAERFARELARQHRLAEALRLRLSRCQSLAAGLERGELPADAAALLGAATASFERLARGELRGPDLAASFAAFPCRDAPGADRIGAAFATAAIASAPYWIDQAEPSASAVELMALGKARLPATASGHFAREIERRAEKAAKWGKPDDIARAVRLCDLKRRLELPVQQYCEVVRTLGAP